MLCSWEGVRFWPRPQECHSQVESLLFLQTPSSGLTWEFFLNTPCIIPADSTQLCGPFAHCLYLLPTHISLAFSHEHFTIFTSLTISYPVSIRKGGMRGHIACLLTVECTFHEGSMTDFWGEDCMLSIYMNVLNARMSKQKLNEWMSGVTHYNPHYCCNGVKMWVALIWACAGPTWRNFMEFNVSWVKKR